MKKKPDPVKEALFDSYEQFVDVVNRMLDSFLEVQRSRAMAGQQVVQRSMRWFKANYPEPPREGKAK